MREVQAALIPVFQFGMFSDSDLSFFAGPDFTFNGRIHTNGNLFLTHFQNATLTLTDKVTAFRPEMAVHGKYGDLLNANEERWHRATSCPNTGRSIRMAITPRSKEGQVHYFQTDQPPGN